MRCMYTRNLTFKGDFIHRSGDMEELRGVILQKHQKAADVDVHEAPSTLCKQNQPPIACNNTPSPYAMVRVMVKQLVSRALPFILDPFTGCTYTVDRW